MFVASQGLHSIWSVRHTFEAVLGESLQVLEEITFFSQTFQTAGSSPDCLSVYISAACQEKGRLKVLGTWVSRILALQQKVFPGLPALLYLTSPQSPRDPALQPSLLLGEQQKQFKVRLKYWVIFLSKIFSFPFVVKFCFLCQFKMVPLADSTHCEEM